MQVANEKLIGSSMSEPHTGELAGGFSICVYIYIYIYVYTVHT